MLVYQEANIYHNNVNISYVYSLRLKVYMDLRFQNNFNAFIVNSVDN